MIVIYTDGGYSRKKKKGKIAYKIGNKIVIENNLDLPEIPGLVQYSNYCELLAVKKALENLEPNQEVLLFVDSQVVQKWIEKNKSLLRISKEHEKLRKKIDELDLRISVSYVPREKNKAGIILEKLTKKLWKTK